MLKRTSALRNERRNQLQFPRLEPRQCLAATLYVDFGLATGDFVVNDTDVACLGGRTIFGDSHELEAFSIPGDINFDEVVDVRDRDAIIDGVMRSLYEIFEPFDVEIQRTDATNFSDIAPASVQAKQIVNATLDSIPLNKYKFFILN